MRVAILSLVLFVSGYCKGSPVSNSTEIPILIPSSSTGDESDAVIIDASEDSTTIDPEISDIDDSFSPSDCYLSSEKGPCRAIIPKYFFNIESKNCELFNWSGCGGNNNKFSTKTSCESNCNVLQTSTESSTGVTIKNNKHKLPNCPVFNGCPDKCVIIQDSSDGGCKKCLCGKLTESNSLLKNNTVELPVGSVSGTPVDNEEEITGDREENCKLPNKRGHCRAMLTRFHYDPALQDCVEFHYGGCDGNSNNFVSKEKCLSYCKGQ